MLKKTLAFLFLASAAYSDTGFYSTVNVTEADGSPKCQVGQLKFSNGSVTCSGQVASVTTSGGPAGGGSGYSVEPATVTFRLNKGVTASTGTFTDLLTGTTISLTSTGINLDNPNGELRLNNIRTLSMTRALPTTINNAVDIGSFTITNGGTVMDIFATVPSLANSLSKRYLVPLKYGEANNNQWTILNAMAQTDPFGATSNQDFSIELKTNNNVHLLRIRRINTGTTAGTVYLTFLWQGVNTDTFDSLSAEYAVAVTTVTNRGTPIYIGNNRLGIGNSNPLTTLHAGPVPATADTAVGLFSNPNAGGEVALLTLSNSAANTSGNAPCLQMIPRGSQDTTTAKMCAVVPTGSSPSTDVYWKLFSSALLEQMRLKSTGELGIGTSAPTQKLEVNGGILAKSSFTVTGSTWAYLISASTAIAAPSINISSTSHINSQSVALTTATACGTLPVLTGSDVAFRVVTGATASGCGIVFARPYTNTPTCVIAGQAPSVINAMSYVVTTSSVTVTKTGLGGETINGICIGRD